MTATRVISSHDELENIGINSHNDIDAHITGSEFLILSSSSHVPVASRKLTAGSGITLVDNGPGSTLVISTSGSIGQQLSISWSEQPSGDVNGINTTYTLDSNPIPSSSLMLFLNGVLQKQGLNDDYVVSGNYAIFNDAPQISGSLQATYPYAASSQISWYETPSGLNDGINMTFTLLNMPNPLSGLMFFINGILQKQGISFDYTMSGSSVQMISSYASGSNIASTYPY